MIKQLLLLATLIPLITSASTEKATNVRLSKENKRMLRRMQKSEQRLEAVKAENAKLRRLRELMQQRNAGETIHAAQQKIEQNLIATIDTRSQKIDSAINQSGCYLPKVLISIIHAYDPLPAIENLRHAAQTALLTIDNIDDSVKTYLSFINQLQNKAMGKTHDQATVMHFSKLNFFVLPTPLRGHLVCIFCTGLTPAYHWTQFPLHVSVQPGQYCHQISEYGTDIPNDKNQMKNYILTHFYADLLNANRPIKDHPNSGLLYTLMMYGNDFAAGDREYLQKEIEKLNKEVGIDPSKPGVASTSSQPK